MEWSVICSKFPTIILFITLQALFTALCHASDHVTGCDTCHAASGDDNVTSCGQVSGLYTRPQLPPGLTIITRIPRGSCDVSVTLLRPGANHLGQCQSRANISQCAKYYWVIRAKLEFLFAKIYFCNSSYQFIKWNLVLSALCSHMSGSGNIQI